MAALEAAIQVKKARPGRVKPGHDQYMASLKSDGDLDLALAALAF